MTVEEFVEGLSRKHREAIKQNLTIHVNHVKSLEAESINAQGIGTQARFLKLTAEDLQRVLSLCACA